MDPITTIGAGLTIIGSKDLLTKVLGPTADYVGGEVKGLIEKCNLNLDNIFVIAKRKLGKRAETDGRVSPRILKNIIDEGRFCEDELTAEYYGGVLAASKSEKLNDDRGIVFLKQLELMSSYQIRLHYIFYNSIKNEFENDGFNMGDGNKWREMGLFFPFDELCKLMGLEETAADWSIITHATIGLHKLGLISDYGYGRPEHLKTRYRAANKLGFILHPNLSGSELLLWSSGLSGLSGHEIFEVKEDLTIDQLKIVKCYERLAKLSPEEKAFSMFSQQTYEPPIILEN